MIILFLLLVAQSLALPPIPNNEFWGSGYNPYLGNPRPTTLSNGADPGWSAYVFDMSTCSNYTSPDGQHCVPIGVDLLPCDFCTLSTTVTVEQGTQSYQETLSKQIKLKGMSIIGIVPFSFGGSFDFKQVMKQSSEYKNIFEETSMQCCTFKLQISPFLPPPVTQEFLAAIKAAPIEYDPAFYIKFLAYFGTMVPYSMTTGALFGARTTFTANSWSQMESTTVDMSAYASAHMWSLSAAAGTMSAQQKQMAATYQMFTTETSTYSYGGKLPANASITAWENTVLDHSLPLTTDFVYISDIIDPFYVPGFNATMLKAIQNNTLTCISKDFCPWLLSQGKVSQCTAVGPDSPLPPKSIFGGFYQVDDCGKDIVSNPFTQALACPVGYYQHQIGRVQAPETKCGAAQFVCLLVGVAQDGQLNYGGGYQTAPQAGNDFGNLNNPLTGSISCPEGFTSMVSGISNGPKITITSYQCINATHTPTYETLGGFYSVTDYGSTNANNPFTNAPSCPPNYCPVRIGRVLIGKVGGTQYTCVVCNILNAL